MAGATQFFIGTGLVIGLLQGVITIATPPPPPLPPISVESLAYSDGFIIQTRTVSTDGPFTAVWTAEILNANTGRAVENCEGSGVWRYPPGKRSPAFPYAEWVGNPKCVLPPGRYIPSATYEAGEFKEVARGDVFEVTE